MAAGDCAVLLSALAYLGHEEPDKIQFAFQQGAQPLSYHAQVPLSLLPQEACDLEQVNAALDRLSVGLVAPPSLRIPPFHGYGGAQRGIVSQLLE